MTVYSHLSYFLVHSALVPSKGPEIIGLQHVDPKNGDIRWKLTVFWKVKSCRILSVTSLSNILHFISSNFSFIVSIKLLS